VDTEADLARARALSAGNTASQLAGA
jgi:hypothetical protein